MKGRRSIDLLANANLANDGQYRIDSQSFESIEEQLENLSMLIDSSRSIMAEKNLDILLHIIMEKVSVVLRADRSSLFLVDEARENLWSRVAQGMTKFNFELGKGIAGSVALTGETVNIADAYHDARFNSEVDKKSGYRTKSILCMPVYDTAGSISGVIQVLNKIDGTPFVKRDEDLLAAFSSLAGISLTNAKAWTEIQAQNEELETRVRERTHDLIEAQKKSDDLLRNILPAAIAEELKLHNKARPRQYDEVTVMFTDFQDFTSVAEQMPPDELLHELDNCFDYFDSVIERYKLEKIKTIGDAYMCAGGLPAENRTHPVDAVLAALEIQKFMNQIGIIRCSMQIPYWTLRLGIHTGPVIAGVVGKKKFAYDIWGDTVNIASRMESSGTIELINISESTYLKVKDFFKCSYRGKVKAKHKGEIDMYYVDGIHPKLSVGGCGEVPNDEFFELYRKMERAE